MRKICNILITIAFMLSSIPPAYAQTALNIPSPGTPVYPSSFYNPPHIKGLQLDVYSPKNFNFIIDQGDSYADEQTQEMQREINRLVQYFMTALAVPDKDLWVNLSPFEDSRIITDTLSSTQLGHDMLAQDYLLKQFTASLVNPETELGQKFWSEIKKESQYTNTESLAKNLFNKVWIMPDQATVYSKDNTVYIVESRLKVLTEQDYLAIKMENTDNELTQDDQIIKKLMDELIIPKIEHEVNEGKNFARIRQIYNTLILAKWYKDTVTNKLLENTLLEKNNVSGFDEINIVTKAEIYNRYVKAYEAGVFSIVKEEYDPGMQEIKAHKYFSGGEIFSEIKPDFASLDEKNIMTKIRNGLKRALLVSASIAMLLSPQQITARENIDQTEIPLSLEWEKDKTNFTNFRDLLKAFNTIKYMFLKLNGMVDTTKPPLYENPILANKEITIGGGFNENDPPYIAINGKRIIQLDKYKSKVFMENGIGLYGGVDGDSYYLKTNEEVFVLVNKNSAQTGYDIYEYFLSTIPLDEFETLLEQTNGRLPAGETSSYWESQAYKNLYNLLGELDTLQDFINSTRRNGPINDLIHKPIKKQTLRKKLHAAVETAVNTPEVGGEPVFHLLLDVLLYNRRSQPFVADAIQKTLLEHTDNPVLTKLIEKFVKNPWGFQARRIAPLIANNPEMIKTVEQGLIQSNGNDSHYAKIIRELMKNKKWKPSSNLITALALLLSEEDEYYSFYDSRDRAREMQEVRNMLPEITDQLLDVVSQYGNYRLYGELLDVFPGIFGPKLIKRIASGDQNINLYIVTHEYFHVANFYNGEDISYERHRLLNMARSENEHLRFFAVFSLFSYPEAFSINMEMLGKLKAVETDPDVLNLIEYFESNPSPQLTDSFERLPFDRNYRIIKNNFEYPREAQSPGYIFAQAWITYPSYQGTSKEIKYFLETFEYLENNPQITTQILQPFFSTPLFKLGFPGTDQLPQEVLDAIKIHNDYMIVKNQLDTLMPSATTHQSLFLPKNSTEKSGESVQENTDKAAFPQNNNNRVGGIDVSNIKINQQGESLIINVDQTQLNQYLNIPVSSFVPQILNISPIQNNLPGLPPLSQSIEIFPNSHS